MRNATLGMVLAVATASDAQNTNWNFEQGSLKGWKAEGGRAFANQPTFEDNTSVRRPGVPVNLEGRYWIGSFENRPNANSALGTTQGDEAMGTLTSDRFKIEKPILRFLCGGGADPEKVRVELLIEPTEAPNIPKDLSVKGLLGAASKKKPGIDKYVVVRIASGANDESMGWVEWDVNEFKGKEAFLRIVDSGSGPMEHINVDAFEQVGSAGPLAAIPALSSEAAAEHERYMAMLSDEAKPKIIEGANELAAAAMAGLAQDQIQPRALQIAAAKFPSITDAEGQGAIGMLILGEASKLCNQQLQTATTNMEQAQQTRSSLLEAIKRAARDSANQAFGNLLSNSLNFGANGFNFSNLALPRLTDLKGAFLTNLSAQFPGVPNLANLPSDWQTLGGEALRALAPQLGANVQLINAFVDYTYLRRQMGVGRSQALMMLAQPLISSQIGKLDTLIPRIKA